MESLGREREPNPHFFNVAGDSPSAPALAALSCCLPASPLVLQRLLSRGGLYPQVLVSAAARFQELLEGLPPLQADAAECGVWQFGQVAAVGLDGGLQVRLDGGEMYGYEQPQLFAALWVSLGQQKEY